MNLAGNIWKNRLESLLETRILEATCKETLCNNSRACSAVCSAPELNFK